MQLVSSARFVGINLAALGDPGPDEIKRGDLGLEHAWERLAVALADDDHNLALARLVRLKATIAAILDVIRGLDIAAEVAAVSAGWWVRTAEAASPTAGRKSSDVIRSAPKPF